MSLKELSYEHVRFCTFNVRPEVVNQGRPGECWIQPGDTILVLGTLVCVEEIQPVGDPDAPEAFTLKVSAAL